MGVAFGTLRGRLPGLLGAVAALLTAAALMTACGTLLETGLRGRVVPERYAAVPIVVAADQQVHETTVKDKGDSVKRKTKSKPVSGRAWLPADIAHRLDAVDGVAAVVPDVTFPARVLAEDGGALGEQPRTGTWGHGWSAARLAPYELVAGAAPAAARDVVVDHIVARTTGLAPGDAVTIQAGEAPVRYRVSGVARPETGVTHAERGTVFFTDEEADRLTGRPEQVVAFGLELAEGAAVEVVADEVADVVAAAGGVVHVGDERDRVEFLAAEQARVRLISLGGALGGTALLVALLVVTGTFALALQQRRRELALLRAVGATPRQVRRTIGVEALGVGLIAGLAGGGVGLLLAGSLRSRFVELGAMPANLALVRSPVPALAAVVVTGAAAVLAARLSARRILQLRPAAAIGASALDQPRLGRVRLVCGIVVLGGYAGLLSLLSVLGSEAASTPVTFLSVIVAVAGVGLLAPLLIRLTVIVLGPLLRRWRSSGWLAAEHAAVSPRRLASLVTPLTLMAAMSMTILSAAPTLDAAADAEFGDGLLADHVVTSTGTGVAADALARIRELPSTTATPRSEGVVRIGLTSHEAQGVDARALPAMIDLEVTTGSFAAFTPTSVALSQRVADGLAVAVGDTVALTLPDATPVQLQVAAIYRRGLGFAPVTVPFEMLAPHTDRPLADHLLVTTRSDAARTRLAAVVDTHPSLRLGDRQTLEQMRAGRQQASAEVNLVAMGLIVAFTAIAVVNSLAMATAGRSGDLALLRLVGASRRQLLRMLRLETLLVVGLGLTLGTAICVATLGAFGLGMAGRASVILPPGGYLLVAVGAATLALAATALPARVVLRSASGLASRDDAPP